MAVLDTTLDITTFDLAHPVSVITESESSRTSDLSLDELAAQIKKLANAENDVVLRSAIAAATLKKRLLNGEAGVGVKWMAWMRRRVKVSEAHLYALVAIGSASDPKDALREYRRKARERNKKRTITTTGLSDNHLKLIAIIRTLSDSEAEMEFRQMWSRYPYRIQ